LGIEAVMDRYGPARTRATDPAELVIDTPTDIGAACRAMHRSGAQALAGGTDLLRSHRQPSPAPGHFVDLRLIPDLARLVTTPDGIWRIGGAVRLADLEGHAADTTPAGVIAAAVRTIASPQIRLMATVGGNLCQPNQCWFLRNDFSCYKRDGVARPCYAVDGDHRFHHAVMGAHRCQAVTPSDLATVLTALDATAVITGSGGSRAKPIADFYRGPGETVLRASEILTDVRVPAEANGRTSAFVKMSRTGGGFAIASACASLRIEHGAVLDARIVMGALAPTPIRLAPVERALIRARRVNPRQLTEIAGCWTGLAHPLAGNGWKVEAAVGLLSSTLERCLDKRD
jgi:CO/xanthine dehydrogenase FAD-binding subunit